MNAQSHAQVSLPENWTRRANHSEFQEQFVRTHIERLGDPQKNGERRGTFTALNPAHIIRMNIGFFGKGFLTKPSFLPIPYHGLTDNVALIFF